MINPRNASNKGITWASSKTSVATVSSTGEVAAVTLGTATITATLSGDNTKTATATLSVISGATIPSSPATATATIKEGTASTVVLSWTPPADTGKGEDGLSVAPIMGYEITFLPALNGISQPLILGSAVISKEFTVTPKKTYTFIIKAKNATGLSSGKTTQISIASSLSAPGTPTNLVISTGITTTTIPLSWAAPSNKGKNIDGNESSIKDYTVSYTTGTTTKTKIIISTGGQAPTSSTTLTGLIPESPYAITVSATNKAGETSGSSNLIMTTTSSAAKNPNAPINLVASTGITTTTIPLSWIAPSDKGKNPNNTTSSLTKYTVTYTTGSVTKTKIVTGIAGQDPALSTTLTGLASGTAYTITVSATNTATLESPASNLITTTTVSAATKPNAPTNLVASTGITTTTILLFWTAPSDKGKNPNNTTSSLIKYTITYTTGSVTKTKIVTGTAGQTPAVNTTLTGLTPRTQYSIKVSATNTANLESDSNNQIMSSTRTPPPSTKDLLGALIYKISQSTPKALPSQIDIDKIEVAKTIFKGLKPLSGATVKLIYVKADGDDTNYGTSWSTALKDIKVALDAILDASPSKAYLLLIGSGIYVPTTTLSMKNHVAIIGGFEGSSDDAKGYYRSVATEINGVNTMQLFNNNGLNVSNIPSTAVLSRVTVTNGKSSTNGGGMYNKNSSPVVTQVTFSNNSAINGGGMYNENASPMVAEMTFFNNSATNGGGMYNIFSSPTVTQVTFSDNAAIKNGGGIHNDNSSPTVTQVTFLGNSADNAGGGISNTFSSPIVTEATFSNNTAKYGGGCTMLIPHLL